MNPNEYAKVISNKNVKKKKQRKVTSQKLNILLINFIVKRNSIKRTKSREKRKEQIVIIKVKFD